MNFLTLRGFPVYHCMTPQDARHTHQFWAIAYDSATVAPADRPEFNRQHHQVIAEDVAIYEAQQHALDASGDGVCADDVRSSILIHADAGLLQARRMIARLREGARI
jgi:phenylpropionate dioxygenase-like ring-hydroxylating dioxygenase large terminal subunit